MAVRLQGFDGVRKLFVGMADRAGKLPRSRKLETSSKLSVIHHHGGRQRVVSEAQRRAIYRKAGPGARVPGVGKVMIHPARPVLVTQRMARDVALAEVRYVRIGGARPAEPIMRTGVSQQFSRGFTPASRDWGRMRARRPTLGGPGGRVAGGWRAARYVEGR